MSTAGTAEWHYSRDGQQTGPVTSAQLKQLATSGQLRPTDVVWKEGMAEWAPASRIKGLFPGNPAGPASPAPVAPAAVVAPVVPIPARATPASEIPYYNPTAGMPARVAQTLKGFPTPRGPQGEWPLSEVHLAQLALAEKQRKAMRGFNSLCQLLVLIMVIVSIGPLIALISIGSGPRMFRGEPMFYLVGFFTAMIAFALLYYLAGRAALKCRIWGPITVTVILGASALWTLGSGFYTMVTETPGPGSADATGALIGMVVALLLSAAFLTVSIRAILAIPRFLAAPVWAQEALINAKL